MANTSHALSLSMLLNFQIFNPAVYSSYENVIIHESSLYAILQNKV
jgi:hypothetical protein